VVEAVAGSAAALAASAADAAAVVEAGRDGERLPPKLRADERIYTDFMRTHMEMTRTRRTAARLMVLALAVLPLSGCTYNRFVTQEEAVKAQWAQVQNQLQRRNDLIPNLVETVKGYAQHEAGVFKDIADARSRLLGAQTPEQTIQAANQQTSALGRLLAIAENYPQLKANEQFNRLMDELAGTENRIAVERMRYNERVQEYNTSRRQFPSNLTAALFRFKEYPLFEAPPEARQVPKVSFTQP
jgi:LemA protein